MFYHSASTMRETADRSAGLSAAAIRSELNTYGSYLHMCVQTRCGDTEENRVARGNRRSIHVCMHLYSEKYRHRTKKRVVVEVRLTKRRISLINMGGPRDTCAFHGVSLYSRFTLWLVFGALFTFRITVLPRQNVSQA